MSLNEVWEAASASPYTPLISKDSQFSVGFTLLLSGKTALRHMKLNE
jgi:cell cycle checkpoint protein